MKIETLLYCIILLYYTLILHCCSKFEVSKIFFNEINTFIQQEYIRLIKSDNKDI